MTDEETHPGTLCFEGALTIREIEGLHARMAEALRDHPAVVIDTSAAGEVDLAFVQLLIAARRTARAQGTGFALAAPAGGPLLEALVRGGLVAADPAARNDDFWMKGSEAP